MMKNMFIVHVDGEAIAPVGCWNIVPRWSYMKLVLNSKVYISVSMSVEIFDIFYHVGTFSVDHSHIKSQMPP